MKLDEHTTLESVFDHLSVGVIVLDTIFFHIQYINAYVHTRLNEPRRTQSIVGYGIQTLLSEHTRDRVMSHLKEIANSKECREYEEVLCEDFLETRGKTYWHISIRPLAAHTHHFHPEHEVLFISLEEVTHTVRSRLLLDAIHRISSTIAGTHSLPQVLDSILDSVHILVGSNHCTILLTDRFSSNEDSSEPTASPAIHIAAQRGMHSSSQGWHTHIDQHVLLKQVVRGHRTRAITDTQVTPDIQFPLIEYRNEPRRPGAVLCIPIIEPTPPLNALTQYGITSVIGSIEVYHPQSRAFPDEDIELLERLAQQAGLAIQNTRLFQNIDQLARAERRNARRQAHIMQALPDGIVIVDPRWRIAETNHAIRTLLGWSHEEHILLGLSLNEALQQSRAIFPPHLIHSTDAIIQYEQKALRGHVDEFKMIGANGHTYTMRCTYTPIRDDVGDTLAFIVTYHDVTEQTDARERVEAEVIARTQELAQRNIALQQAQIAQETERARIELLLERLPSSILLISAQDTSIMRINSCAIELLRLIGVSFPDEVPARQLIGASYEELLRSVTLYGSSGSIVSQTQQPLALALRDGKATELELHTQDVEGQTIYLLANAAPLRSPDGKVTSAILVLHNITPLKALEQAREDFFTTMAHELKTPLANVRAHLSALLQHDVNWSPEDQRGFLQTADEQIERLVSMINHILDASRVEAGALRPAFEPVLTSELIEDLQERLSALIVSSQRRLEVLLPPQLPSFEADYELIMSVLTNLLSNAFRYAPQGDVVTLTVTLECQKPGETPTGITFSIRDRGIGIPLEQQKQLFTRFSTFAAFSRSQQTAKGQQAARWSPTSGLGLYISRGIVEAHNGSLKLTSVPGQGTCFAFTLPLTQESYR